MHIAQGKGLVTPGAAAEKAQDLIGEEAEAERLQRADDKRVPVDHIGGLFHPPVVSGSVVEAHDRLPADAAADDRGIEEKVDFCDDAGCRQGFAAAVFGQGSVVSQGAVEDQVHDQHGRLVQAARRSDRHDLSDLVLCHRKMIPQQLPRFEAQHIAYDQNCGGDLTQDRCDRRACNAHI